MSDSVSRERQIREHLEAIRRLEAEAALAAAAERAGRTSDAPGWPPRGYYLLWHVVVGMLLGSFGAIVSLLANALGAPLFGEPALKLIRVYLTFPMGEQALHAEAGHVLFVGCLLYLATGALYGIGFHLVMSVLLPRADFAKRWLVATGIGLGLWIVNFYFVLSWLQPLLLGGDWIVRLVPAWVAALTHVAFAWTMLVVERFGHFEPYRVRLDPRSPALLLGLLGAIATAPGCGGGVSAAPAGAAEPQAASPSDPRPEEYPRFETLAPGAYRAYNQRASLHQRGKIVYENYCLGCHGVAGDGQGPAAARLLTKPRDFTKGIYKFRSTDSSSLPLESDLHRTITRGLGGAASMPGFPLLAERDKLAVIEYLKSFYPKWESRKNERVVVPQPLAPSDLGSPQRIARGRIVFLAMQCSSCHGVYGASAATEQTEFVDAWGQPQKAFDFTRGSLKGGSAPEDIYRTFHTGLRSIMPAYAGDTLAGVTRLGFEAQERFFDADERERLAPYLDDFPSDPQALFRDTSELERAAIAERNSWDLVAYVLSLRQNGEAQARARAVLGPDTPITQEAQR